MQKETSNLESSVRERRRNLRRRDALEILLKARDGLIAEMAEEIRLRREALVDSNGEQNVLGFEFQEIEDRYTARLHALNSILENLEYRRPRLAHRIETLSTTSENLKKDLNGLVSRFDQWDLVDVTVTQLADASLLAVVSFTADDYGE
jgi:chromosome segregation ATPase